jgi:hypothetical protein
MLLNLLDTSTSRVHIFRSRNQNCAQEDLLEDKMMKIKYKLGSISEKMNITSKKLKHSSLFKREVN